MTDTFGEYVELIELRKIAEELYDQLQTWRNFPDWNVNDSHASGLWEKYLEQTKTAKT